MTLQNLYEQLVLRTVNYAKHDKNNYFYEFSKSLPQNLSFAEIGIRASMFGIKIPHKENFKKWGEKYLIQCLYFLCDTNYCLCDPNENLLSEFFKCLMNHKSTLKLLSDDFKSACYGLYVDNICADKYICTILSKYIVKHCNQCDFYDKFFTIANSTGLLSYEINYSDFLKTRPKGK